MTVNIVFESFNRQVRSSNSNYTLAVNGSSFDNTTGTSSIWGQHLDGSTYRIYQNLLEFDFTAVAGERISTANFVFQNSAIAGTGVSRIMELRAYDFGSIPGPGAWLTPSDLTAAPLITSIANAQSISSGDKSVRLGLPDTRTQLASTTSLRYFLASSRNRLQQAPTTNETNTFRTPTTENATSPTLSYHSVVDNTLYRNLGAQVKLSGGTSVYVDMAASTISGPNMSFSLVSHDNTSETTIGSISATGDVSGNLGGVRGYQAMTLVADASDNLYWIRAGGRDSTSITVGVWAKQSGLNWAFVDNYFIGMPVSTQYGYINNLAATWHNAGTAGTIMVIAGFNARAGVNGTGQNLSFALLDCNYMVNDIGTTAVRASSLVSGLSADSPNVYSNNAFTNDTGSLLDIAKAPDSERVGYVVTTTADTTVDGQNTSNGTATLSVGRYELNSGGTGFTSTRVDRPVSSFPARDGAGKFRIIGVGSTQWVAAAIDPSDNFGLTFSHAQQTSSAASQLANIWMGGESITSLPLGSELSNSAAWDMAYSSPDNKVWFYYFDRNNGRRLMKTAVDLSTGQALRNEVEVSSSVGVSGSTNHALRIHRGDLKGPRVVVNVANQTSGGTHSLISVTDNLNAPPSAPTLNPKANFDADDAAQFTWNFNDVGGDTQSAFQLVIDQVGIGTVHDTTKTVSANSNYTLAGSTILNGQDFTWNVTVWDSFDVQSPVSSNGTFTTSNTGVVTITDPASDNPAGVITDNYLFQWSVSGATQEDRRVVVRRTDTEALLIDTGWVTTATQSYEVVGMLTDVEYRVEVTIREDLVESNTAERLITPSYGTPEIPTVTTETFSEGGYIELTVINPTPQGDRPTPVRNDIYRRPADTLESFILVGSCDPNSMFRDYQAASHATYEYLVRAETE